MSSNLVANRYAKALLSFVNNSQALQDKALTFLVQTEEMFVIPEFKRVLKSPVMPIELKRELLRFIADKSGASEDFNHFIDQVLEAGRTALMPEISAAFHEMLSRKRGIASANAVTAEPMEEDLKLELAKALEKVFHKKIVLKNEVDKNVLGGVVVNVGNFAIDLSLRSRLNSLADAAQR